MDMISMETSVIFHGNGKRFQRNGGVSKETDAISVEMGGVSEVTRLVFSDLGSSRYCSLEKRQRKE